MSAQVNERTDNLRRALVDLLIAFLRAVGVPEFVIEILKRVVRRNLAGDQPRPEGYRS